MFIKIVTFGLIFFSTLVFFTQIFIPICYNRSLFPFFKKDVKNILKQHTNYEDEIYKNELKTFNENLKQKLNETKIEENDE